MSAFLIQSAMKRLDPST